AKPSAAVTATAPTQSAKPATTPAPAAAAPAAAAPAATANASTGNVGSLKSAPGSHYTLQLSSSSNYNNLNAWAKKENLKNFVVYQTSRNGQPWYVLVSGVYASKDDAKRAVSTLPADVQAKNPWAKPLHQVQADLK
ncbi:SPOR domain-containing protein, partial [Pseudescherichia sp.]